MTASIAAVAPYRERLAELAACSRWLRISALEIANSKDRTLEIARKLGIDQPRSMRIDSLADLSAVFAEFTFPFVLKPTVSWSGRAGRRLVPAEVVDEAEAVDVTGAVAGCGGRRAGAGMGVRPT